MITLVSSSVVITVPGLTRLPTLMLRKPTRPANGARMIVSFNCDRAAGDTRFVRTQRRLQLIELRFGQRLRREQLAAALVLTSAFTERGFGFGKVRPRLLAVEFDQHLAALTCWPSRK